MARATSFTAHGRIAADGRVLKERQSPSILSSPTLMRPCWVAVHDTHSQVPRYIERGDRELKGELGMDHDGADTA
jgi:hypothetical protein